MDDLVSFRDFAPTLLEAAGLTPQIGDIKATNVKGSNGTLLSAVNGSTTSSAHAGWDFVTGWGAINMDAFIATQAPVACFGDLDGNHEVNGADLSLLLLDEASRVPDETYVTLRPMLAVSGGDLWLLSTPGGKSGFFWEAWELGGEEWARFRGPATECKRISAEWLESERRALGDRWFRQEYLCEFVADGSALFDREAILEEVVESEAFWN